MVRHILLSISMRFYKALNGGILTCIFFYDCSSYSENNVITFEKLKRLAKITFLLNKIKEPVGDLEDLLEKLRQLEEKELEVVLKRILIYRSKGDKITRNKFGRTFKKTCFLKLIRILVVLFDSSQFS